jgi:hypothetical protein
MNDNGPTIQECSCAALLGTRGSWWAEAAAGPFGPRFQIERRKLSSRCSTVQSTANCVAAMPWRFESMMWRRIASRWRPVRFELTEQTRQASDDYLHQSVRKAEDFLFEGPGNSDCGLTTCQYARLVGEWISSIGLDRLKFGTHSLRRTSDLPPNRQSACCPTSARTHEDRAQRPLPGKAVVLRPSAKKEERTAGILQLAADLLQRASRQDRAKSRLATNSRLT